MSRLSATTNPTNLKEIARKDVNLRVFEVSGERHFQLVHLALSDYKLNLDSLIVVVARAGNTSRRYEAGTVNSWVNSAFDLNGLDASRLLRFRLLIRNHDSAQLVASAENLRAAGEGDIESLLPIVTAELGQRLWRLMIDEDGPVLQCNSRVFPNGASAENFVPFRALVLPEALRQILVHIAKDPEKLNVEGSAWHDWQQWMQLLQIELPPDHADQQRQWIDDSTARFCDRFRSADELQEFLHPGEKQ